MRTYIFIFSLMLLIAILQWCFNKISNSVDKSTISTYQYEILKDKFQKLWLTWSKLEKAIKRQAEILKKINSLTWEAKKIYILETKILPNLVEDNFITPSFCKTKDINLYARCLYQKRVDINKVLDKIPQDLRNTFRKIYFYEKYSSDRKTLLKKTSDPIALEQKKKVLRMLHMMWVLRNSSACNKLPEKETRQYCKDLFK